MNSLSKLRMMFLYLCFTSLCFNFVYSGLVDTNRVATLNGLVAIKDLKLGDKVLTYNFNATIPEASIKEATVTKIEKHFTDSVFFIHLEGDRSICLSPQQVIFTGKQEFDDNGNVHIVIELIQAQYLTTEHMLIDAYFNLHSIVFVSKHILYEEKRVHGKHLLGLITKGNTITTKFDPIDTYSIEMEEPHIFLIPAGKYGINFKDDPDLPLILMHNGLPALALGASFAFGSTPASVAFAEATMTAGGLTATLGPAGLALGVTAGAGYFLYNLFSKNNNDRLYLEKSDQNSSSGGNNQKDPKNKDNKDAHNVNAKENLKSKLGELESAQKSAVKTKTLPDGRIRYYEQERLAKNPGSTRGNAHVTEYNPKTGQIRSWAESYNHNGEVTRVHPKTLNGQQLKSQHYPPTALEK